MPDTLPKLKASIQATPYETTSGERLVFLRDSQQPKSSLVLPTRTFYVASLLDGATDSEAVRHAYEARFGDELLDATVQETVARLRKAGMLEDSGGAATG